MQKIVSRPGPTALQFESPHLGGLVLTSSVPEMNLALPNGDPARSNSVNSSQLPPPADPAEAFERVLREIRNAKSDASIYPGISIQCYRKALRIINSISDSSPSITNEILFYKAYYAAICEIGLSHIESPPSSHLDKASKYNEQALILVEGVNNTKLTPRATLNKAQIKQFIAEIQERAGTGNKSTIHSTIHESSTLYTTVINLLRGNCQGMADHHILAQALLGCGRVNKKLTISAGGWYAGLSSGGGAKRWSISRAPSSKNDASKATTPLQDPQACFYEALKVVEEGIAVGKVEGEIEEALDEITLLRDDIKKALSHLQRQTYSS